jgi:hypothetical protein
MRPESFHQELSEHWSRWVLGHGLPEIPGHDLGVGESVPVAYWMGPSTAAVLHIRRFVWDDEEDPEIQTDVELFCLIDAEWETCGGGGGGWSEESPLRRVDVEPRHATLDGMTGGWSADRGCTALWGEVGTDAATVEVMQAGQLTRRPVEAPVGAIVVCADYAKPFTVRILDAQDRLLAKVEQPAGFDEEPPRPRP